MVIEECLKILRPIQGIQKLTLRCVASKTH
jgi:hypothetical protein